MLRLEYPNASGTPVLQAADLAPHLLVTFLGKWGFPKNTGAILGVSIIRAIVFRGLFCRPLFWETTKCSVAKQILGQRHQTGNA